MTDIHNWSGTDASNNAANPAGWGSGQLPSKVLDTGRAMMGATKRQYDQQNFTLTSGGTASAFTLTPSPAIDALANGQRYGFIANAAPNAAATLNVNGKGAKTLKKRTPGGLVNLGGNDWVSGDYIEVVYNLSGDYYVVTNIRTQKEAVGVVVLSDATPLSTGTAKFTFRMPYAFVLLAGNNGIRASLVTAQTSGSVVTVDVNEAGVSILSTKLTFDNTEKTTTTAATPPVLSDTALADDAEITIDIDQIGDGTAKGLKVTLIGYQVAA